MYNNLENEGQYPQEVPIPAPEHFSTDYPEMESNHHSEDISENNKPIKLDDHDETQEASVSVDSLESKTKKTTAFLPTKPSGTLDEPILSTLVTKLIVDILDWVDVAELELMEFLQEAGSKSRKET